MKGLRLLTQIMPYTYRQGFSYPTKGLSGKGVKKMKRYGGKILRKWLKTKLQDDLQEIDKV